MKRKVLKMISALSVIALLLILNNQSFKQNGEELAHGGKPVTPELFRIGGKELAHEGKPVTPELFRVGGKELAHGGKPVTPELFSFKKNSIV